MACPKCRQHLTNDDLFNGSCPRCFYVFTPDFIKGQNEFGIQNINAFLENKKTGFVQVLKKTVENYNEPVPFSMVAVSALLVISLIALFWGLYEQGNFFEHLLFAAVFVAMVGLTITVVIGLGFALSRCTTVSREYPAIRCPNCGYMGEAYPRSFWRMVLGGARIATHITIVGWIIFIYWLLQPSIVCPGCGYQYVVRLR